MKKLFSEKMLSLASTFIAGFLIVLTFTSQPAKADGIFAYLFGSSVPPEVLENEIEGFNGDISDLNDKIDETVENLQEISKSDLKDAEKIAENTR